MSRTARHGPCAAVAQTLLARAGRARGAKGGERVGQVTLPSHLPPEASGFVNLGVRREIHYVTVSMCAQVCRALSGLVAVLQKN